MLRLGGADSRRDSAEFKKVESKESKRHTKLVTKSKLSSKNKQQRGEGQESFFKKKKNRHSQKVHRLFAQLHSGVAAGQTVQRQHEDAMNNKAVGVSRCLQKEAVCEKEFGWKLEQTKAPLSTSAPQSRGTEKL